MTTIDSRTLRFERESGLKPRSGLGCSIVFLGLALSTALVFELGFQYGELKKKNKKLKRKLYLFQPIKHLRILI